MKKVRIAIGNESEFNKTSGQVVTLGEGGECALFYDDGKWFAVGSLCPHQNASLEGAEVEEGAVVCKRHGYRFDLKSGDCLTVGGYGLPVFAAELSGGILYISYWEYEERNPSR